MQIEIRKPHADYPFAYIRVGIETNTENSELVDILGKNRITLLGPWTFEKEDGGIKGFTAPVLLEDEHVKPRKARSQKKQAL